jgi:hypothetical protein
MKHSCYSLFERVREERIRKFVTKYNLEDRKWQISDGPLGWTGEVRLPRQGLWRWLSSVTLLSVLWYEFIGLHGAMSQVRQTKSKHLQLCGNYNLMQLSNLRLLLVESACRFHMVHTIRSYGFLQINSTVFTFLMVIWRSLQGKNCVLFIIRNRLFL